MQLNNLKRKNKNKKSPRVGRGGKRGKTSGKGTKGQNARAGRKKRPELRDIIKRLPKLRGRGKNLNTSIAGVTTSFNLKTIDANFSAGDVVSPRALHDSGILRLSSGKYPRVKILGDGELTKKLIFKSCVVSKSAKEKIVKAGGSVM